MKQSRDQTLQDLRELEGFIGALVRRSAVGSVAGDSLLVRGLAEIHSVLKQGLQAVEQAADDWRTEVILEGGRNGSAFEMEFSKTAPQLETQRVLSLEPGWSTVSL